MNTEIIIAIAAIYAALGGVTFVGLWADNREYWQRREIVMAAVAALLWPFALPTAGACSLWSAWNRGRE